MGFGKDSTPGKQLALRRQAINRSGIFGFGHFRFPQLFCWQHVSQAQQRNAFHLLAGCVKFRVAVTVDNRTCALRVIAGSEEAQRVEYRVGAADANPYLILAAALASGLAGIEQGWETEPKVTGNAYDQSFPAHMQLPVTLW
ncbi:MAG: hypothetical protein COC23_08700, partial [Hyphomicrobiales bacterium]